jgi:hypothetical protein
LGSSQITILRVNLAVVGCSVLMPETVAVRARNRPHLRTDRPKIPKIRTRRARPRAVRCYCALVSRRRPAPRSSGVRCLVREQLAVDRRRHDPCDPGVGLPSTRLARVARRLGADRCWDGPMVERA